MKLHQALRKIIREYGVPVLCEKRLLFILSDFSAFEEHPDLSQLFETIVADGSGMALSRLALDDDNEGCLSFAGGLRKSLSSHSHAGSELVNYAVDSILFALGMQTAVSAPSDAPSMTGKEAKGEKGVAGSGASGSSTCGAPDTGAKGSTRVGNWLGAAVILAAFALGFAGGMNVNKPAGQTSAAVQPAAVRASGNSAAQGSDGTKKGSTAAAANDAKTPVQPGQHEFDQGLKYEQRSINRGEDHYAEAAGLYRKAADLGHPLAQLRLGRLYMDGRGVMRDDAEAVKLFRKSAELGNSAGEYYLGWMYLTGRGGIKNYQEALKLFRRSAEQEYRYAYFGLGVMYGDGLGVAKDEQEAAKWFRKGAEKEDTRAQAILGAMYYDGCGVTSDYAEALKWLRKSLGNAYAEYYLGLMYLTGQGVARDYAESVKWFRKSAEQGFADSAYYLARMYEAGRGVERDDAKAVDWYMKAAEKGDRRAQYSLGTMYENGKGVKADLEEALKWYRKSADKGYGMAADRIKSLEKLPSGNSR